MTSSKTKLPLRVFAYGCRPPVTNRELIEQQLALAHSYRNKLVEIEVDRRARYRLLTGEQPRVAAIQTEIVLYKARLEELRSRIKLARADPASATLKRDASEQARVVRGELKKLFVAAKEAREELRSDDAIVRAVRASDLIAAEAVRRARAECGLFWGTYRLVERAASDAGRSAGIAKFVDWNGGGRIGVQLQSRTTAEDVMRGRSTWLKIDELPEVQWQSRAGRRAAKTFVHMRIGSDEKRRPVWATFPVLIHRPLPSDAVIKEAYVIRRLVAQRSVYELHMVLESALVERPLAPMSAPVAAINFGWRSRPDGLRVGMLVDEYGVRRELLLPISILDRLDHADSITSIRDRNLDAIREPLATAMRKLSAGNAPSWFIDFCDVLSACGPTPVHSFVTRWRSARLVGDGDAFAIAEAWKYTDFHLLQWSTFERRRALNDRRELYRLIAVDLSSRYSVLVFHRFDMRTKARRAAPEDDRALVRSQLRNRHRAAISSLRGEIGKRNRIQLVQSVDDTHTCHRCGCLEFFDAALCLEHTCSQCGTVWDQDVNAGENCLRRHRDGLRNIPAGRESAGGAPA